MASLIGDAFSRADGDMSGCITLDEFSLQLDTFEVQSYLRMLDVDPSEVQGLFALLDADGSGGLRGRGLSPGGKGGRGVTAEAKLKFADAGASTAGAAGA